MKAVVWHGVGDIRLDEVPDPTIQEPTDAIVEITASAICGTDLHFVRGHDGRHGRGHRPRPRGRRRRRGGRPRCAQPPRRVTASSSRRRSAAAPARTAAPATTRSATPPTPTARRRAPASSAARRPTGPVDGLQARVRARPVRQRRAGAAARRGHRRPGHPAVRHLPDGLVRRRPRRGRARATPCWCSAPGRSASSRSPAPAAGRRPGLCVDGIASRLEQARAQGAEVDRLQRRGPGRGRAGAHRRHRRRPRHRRRRRRRAAARSAARPRRQAEEQARAVRAGARPGRAGAEPRRRQLGPRRRAQPGAAVGRRGRRQGRHASAIIGVYPPRDDELPDRRGDEQEPHRQDGQLQPPPLPPATCSTSCAPARSTPRRAHPGRATCRRSWRPTRPSTAARAAGPRSRSTRPDHRSCGRRTSGVLQQALDVRRLPDVLQVVRQDADQPLAGGDRRVVGVVHHAAGARRASPPGSSQHPGAGTARRRPSRP